MSATCFRCAVGFNEIERFIYVPIYKRRLALKIVHKCSTLENWLTAVIMYICFALWIEEEGYKKVSEANEKIKHRRMSEELITKLN